MEVEGNEPRPSVSAAPVAPGKAASAPARGCEESIMVRSTVVAIAMASLLLPTVLLPTSTAASNGVCLHPGVTDPSLLTHETNLDGTPVDPNSLYNAPIDTGNVDMPTTTGSPMQVNMSTTPGTVEWGERKPAADLTLTCLTPNALYTLATPGGLLITQHSDRFGRLAYASVDLTAPGTFQILNEAGVPVNSFVPVNVSPPPGIIGTSCTPSPTEVRVSVYDNPATTYYAASTDYKAPIFLRAFSLKGDWGDGCGPTHSEIRAAGLVWTVNGASKASSGAYYGYSLQTTGLGAKRNGGLDYTAYDAHHPGFYVDKTTYTYLSGLSNQASYDNGGASLSDVAQKAAINLGYNFLTQSWKWWVSPIIDTAVDVYSSYQRPYSAAVTGWTDPWYSNSAAGGIVYNVWASPAWGSHDVATLADVWKTSNAQRTVHTSARFTLYMDDSYYKAQPEQVWGVHVSFTSYPIL